MLLNTLTLSQATPESYFHSEVFKNILNTSLFYSETLYSKGIRTSEVFAKHLTKHLTQYLKLLNSVEQLSE